MTWLPRKDKDRSDGGGDERGLAVTREANRRTETGVRRKGKQNRNFPLKLRGVA